MTTARTVARNTIWSLSGYVLPLGVAVAAVPILLDSLGMDRFGILALAWAAVGYFSLFDFGLARVLTQSVSTSLVEADETKLAELTRSALVAMTLLGIAAAIVSALATPLLVSLGLRIPLSLRAEAERSFYILSATIPFVLSTSGFRGILEAHQDFRIATFLRLPYAVFNFVGPLLVIPFSTSLVPIVALLAVGRVVIWVAHVVSCFRRFGYLSRPVPIRLSSLYPLLRMGGWMTASNLIAPLMYSVDRYLIGGLLSLAAVTYYVTPFDLVTKLLVLPAALIGVLFPAFAASHAHDRVRSADLFERAFRLIAVAMFPAIILLMSFAPEGLTLWVGADMAREGAPVARWLTIGIFANALAQVCFTLIQAVGRPDLTAKLHIAELPVYAATLVWLTIHYGVTGVAIAWTGRVIIDAAALIIIVAVRLPETRPALRASSRVIILLGASAMVPMAFRDLWPRAIATVVIVAAAAALVWIAGLRRSEKDVLLRFLRPIRDPA